MLEIINFDVFTNANDDKNNKFYGNFSSPVYEVQAWPSIHAFLDEELRRTPSIWHFHVRVTPCVSHFAFAPILCEIIVK